MNACCWVGFFKLSCIFQDQTVLFVDRHWKVAEEKTDFKLNALCKSFTMTGAEATYSSHIANCVFNAFLSYTAIMLNSVTIYVVRKTSSLPKNLKILLLSLAVSDLGAGLIVQPFYIARLIIRLEPNPKNNPAYIPTAYAFRVPFNLLYFASFFGVTALTVDRFLAIHLHLRDNELVTHKRVAVVLISIWVLSAILSLVRLFVPGKGMFIIFAAIMAVCLVTSAVLYCKIYLAVRHHANQIHALQVQQEAPNGETRANAARLRKSAVSTFYVYLGFLVCYLLEICIYVAVTISGWSTALVVLQLNALTLVFLNSCLNPLIYCWKMRHIRHAIMDLLRQILQSRNWEKLLLKRNNQT